MILDGTNYRKLPISLGILLFLATSTLAAPQPTESPIPVRSSTLQAQSAPVPSEDDLPTTLAGPRPAAWAVPLQRPGLPNLHRVSNTLYRGAQPTAEGIRELKKMGIKTVVNLRSFHSDRALIGDTGLDYVHIYSQAWHAEDEDVVAFLKVVTDPERQPVFVHCQHGSDRTGTMCAAYRIVVEGWSKDEAIREMTQGGFGYHAIWKNLIRYVRRLDVDALKRAMNPKTTNR